MSRLKRMVFLAVICSASYVGLLLRGHNMFSSNPDRPVANVIPLLVYQPLSAVQGGEPDNSESELSQKVRFQDVLDEDITLDQDFFQDIINSTVAENKQTGESAGVQGDEYSDFNHHTDRQRTVRFTRVGDMYIYGAYLDLRRKGNFTVRILVLKHRRYKDGLVCRIADGERQLVLYAQAYKMCENHEKMFEGWIYSCVLPNTLRSLPHQVSVVPFSQRQRHSKISTIFTLKRIQPKSHSAAGQIGVCVPPLFGDLNLSFLINFIQMCKVLGADKVFMYLGSVSSEIKKFLKYYSENDASLSVFDWNLPENLSQSKDKIWYHGQLLAVQDCLYHNMDSFHFLLFMDLDEMLVPQDTYDWRRMLSKVFKTENRDSVATLSFQSIFFDPTKVPEDSEHILYFQHVHRTRSASRVRNKLMVQPLKVFELGIHHLSKALSEEFQSVTVSENTALLHHYHMCVQVYEPQMKCYPTKKDKTMLRYKEKLTLLSQRVITDASKLFA